MTPSSDSFPSGPRNNPRNFYCDFANRILRYCESEGRSQRRKSRFSWAMDRPFWTRNAEPLYIPSFF
jgi:hypothetical protein